MIITSKFYIAIAAGLLIAFSFVPAAFAHQRQLFTIGDKDYLFVVGSAGEPVFIDDKSGVEMFVYKPDPADPMNSSANGTMPIEGLEKNLKVEVTAGNKSKIFDLEPAFRDPGHYEAPFFPTIETTYSYRIFGDINGTSFDTTWTCTPGGGEAKPISDNSTLKISDDVTRKGIMGGFGCPESREDASFPEIYISNNEIVKRLDKLENPTGNQ